MFNGIFGIGRAYKRLPAHHNFKELADNIERLADYLMDRSLRGFGNEDSRWEWELGEDLKLLLEYARGFVPSDSDGLHYYSGRGTPPYEP